MNYLPPLRNYQQMVRVVKNDSHGGHLAKPAVDLQLANAFGDHHTNAFDNLFSNGGISPTELQIRTLDSMNLVSSSLRRPGKTNGGGLLPTRSGSTLFHDLNHSTRDYMNGMTGGLTLSRQDSEPGTKLRTELNPNSTSKVSYLHHHSAHHSDAKKHVTSKHPIHHSSLDQDNHSHTSLHPVDHRVYKNNHLNRAHQNNHLIRRPHDSESHFSSLHHNVAYSKPHTSSSHSTLSSFN